MSPAPIVSSAADSTVAERRAEIAGILAAGVLRLAAERAGVERKRMRTPELRFQTPAVTPPISSRYDLLSPSDQSVGVARQGEAQPARAASRVAKRGSGRHQGAADPERGARR
jgi:hypothetical protein